ncbi:MAG: Ig-like domain-containing protein [Vicinamibacteria bacterium]|jgi:hypothetical protein|nr:Ig-like domain-containing protein [Vicinamibacteria bacterium]
MGRGFVIGLLISATFSTSASAQFESADMLDQMYGPVVDVKLADLVQSSAPFKGHAIRTRGWLGRETNANDASQQQFFLRDMMAQVRLVPHPSIAQRFYDEFSSWKQAELQVTGLYSDGTRWEDSIGGYQGVIEFWRFVISPPPRERPTPARSLSLAALLASRGKRDGEWIRVVGEFRGANLFGDLPAQSMRQRADWVIRHDNAAVWITGRKPQGQGWHLDPALKRDTGKWIGVTGRAETRAGITYIRAKEVFLTGPPSIAPEPTPLGRQAVAAARPKIPPVIVFSLPLDGEDDVAMDARIRVQFSNDIDEASLTGRVLVRYAGQPRPGDRPFDHARLQYDSGRRALLIDPGDLLLPGREIEIRLLPGIIDVDGLALVPRPGKSFHQAIDVLRYRIGLTGHSNN